MAIEAFEGKESVPAVPYRSSKKTILRVRKDKKGTITHYDVEGLGWLSKVEAIAFTKAGEIDAVIAKTRGWSSFSANPS